MRVRSDTHSLSSRLLPASISQILSPSHLLLDNISDNYTYSDYHCFYSSKSAYRGGGALLLFSPSYSVMQITNIPVQPLDTCNTVLVVDVNSELYWVLVYHPEEMSQDITAVQVCRLFIG